MLALVSTFRSCQMGRSQGSIMKTDIVSILLLRNIIISKMTEIKVKKENTNQREFKVIV